MMAHTATETKIKNSYSPVREFLKKFWKQRLAVVAGFVTLGIILISVIAPYIVPYDPNRPVTAQYAEKGINVADVTNHDEGMTVKNSDGQTVTDMYPTVNSNNRRVVNARQAENSIKFIAVNAGFTYVTVNIEDVTVALAVSVSEAGDPILSKLVAKELTAPLAVNGSGKVELAGIMSDGKEITDSAAMLETLKAMQGGGDDSGWGISSDPELTYESLTPDILEVAEDGTLKALAEGTGKVKISLGEISTVLPVPVGVAKAEPVITDIVFDKYEVKLADIYKHQPPSGRHWFGTDHQNRDIFSRVLVGTQATLIIGFFSVFIGALIGTILGLMAGYYGRWVDGLLTRFCDVLLAFPGILLAIAVIAVLGPGLINIIFAVAFFTIPIFLRIVRGSAMELKNTTYVEAARSIGVKDWVIIYRHIFPGTLSIVMVYLTMRIGTAILIGASLSFLGLGGDITAPEWGAMLSAAKDNSRNLFHPTFFPGLAIVITVLAFNILGDGLRDALDPKIND